MSAMNPPCPSCCAQHTVKNGRIHNKKRKYKCQVCGRQFVESPSKKVISQEIKALIDKLLLERVSLAGIARATGVSKKWRQDYVNAKYRETYRQVNVKEKPKGKLTIECDEAWRRA